MTTVVERRGQAPLIIRERKKSAPPVIEKVAVPVIDEPMPSPKEGRFITKDMIGRNFRRLGRHHNTVYHVDVDKNVYSEELGKIFYMGTFQSTPLEEALRLGKYKQVFQVHDWAPSIFN